MGKVLGVNGLKEKCRSFSGYLAFGALNSPAIGFTMGHLRLSLSYVFARFLALSIRWGNLDLKKIYMLALTKKLKGGTNG